MTYESAISLRPRSHPSCGRFALFRVFRSSARISVRIVGLSRGRVVRGYPSKNGGAGIPGLVPGPVPGPAKFVHEGRRGEGDSLLGGIILYVHSGVSKVLKIIVLGSSPADWLILQLPTAQAGPPNSHGKT